MASLREQGNLQTSKQQSELNEANTSALLEECNEKIAQLETQLAEQRDIKANLEQRLASLHTNALARILNDLPEDVLIGIFFELICGNPLEMAIGPILLVCRRWYNIASNTPLLWTNIASNLRPDDERVNRATKYVEVAIRKSRSLPLNVTMKVLSPASLLQDIVEKLYPLSLEGNRKVKGEAKRNIISRRAETIRWFEEVSSYVYSESRKCSISHFPLFTRLSDAVNNHIDAFIGEELIPRNIDRIRSLTVYFDSHETLFWPGRGHDLLLWRFKPEPERLTIIDEAIGVKDPSSFFPPYTYPSPNLKYLSWGAASPLGSVIGEGKQLTHLRLYWHRGLGIMAGMTSNLPNFSLTQNLRQLFLYCAGHTSREVSDDKDNLVFPQLEDLSLAGTINRSVFEALKVPRLSTLRLVDCPSCRSVLSYLPDSSSLSSINKLHMHMHIYTNGECTIDQTLKLFPSISELGIVGESIESVKDCIIKMRTGAIPMKGYKYSKASYWRFDPYDNQEIVIDS